ncbi:CDP-4-dehydro-6-deoxyglucose reductase/phenol hydroxylase P5 protein [Paenibacillus taihuensis]|uniref:CDP-4-dehydro-6-deoxyglucose reductase/phenol hydroxylase P5 protein n=1 Tax=Paenibacillus taihuensis TaxID=1156355 RepID=A0A3D9RHA9_9BACL|nr:2Fe-2S iron-sulfur cluster-binding protein [Paenibacillus taihuensis]REE77698.1 CDP-4-dehydro-6-deoxyglucose reductase/phenol hydroxylase P5 protein [Paenibacillus taihuensis]
MSEYRITLESGESFMAKQGELLLDAALRQGVTINHSCRNGTCRTCLFEIKEGSVTQEGEEICMISQQERENGRRLLCMSTANSDAVLGKLQRRKRASEGSAVE